MQWGCAEMITRHTPLFYVSAPESSRGYLMREDLCKGLERSDDRLLQPNRHTSALLKDQLILSREPAKGKVDIPQG